MSLISALNLASGAMSAEQLALQTTGNNISNANDPNYTREITNFDPSPDQQYKPGVMVGTGVTVTSVQRQVDEALNERLRSSVSDQSSAQAQANWSGQVQSVFNALSGNDVGTQMGTFFNSWSTLANNPSDNGARQVVIQNGQQVAGTLNSLSNQLHALTTNLSDAVTSDVKQINTLARDLGKINSEIVTGGTGSNALMDQRDADLQKLAKLGNIQVEKQPSGAVNIYLGSQQIVTNTTVRRLTVTTVENNGHLDASVTFADDQSTADVTGGDLGGVLQSQQLLDTSQTRLDRVASNLIFALNKLHASGQGTQGFSSVTSTNQVTDATQPLGSIASGMAFSPTNGSFVVHVTNKLTGLTTSSLVNVNLTGSPGDTTLNSLTTSLNSIASVSATTSGGFLQIKSSDPNSTITFSQDSSGALAALGINTFYTGQDAATIAVNATVASTPQLLAAGKTGSADDNSNALAISALGGANLATLNNTSLTATYRNLVTHVGTVASTAVSNQTAASTVVQTLQAQQQSLSGVSSDQEAVNLMAEQRAFQAAAYLITTLNNMMSALFAIT